MLLYNVVRIQLTFAESPDPLDELLGGRLQLAEVLEGRQEFLEALMSRLQAITEFQTDGADEGEETLPLRRPRPTTSSSESGEEAR